MSDNSKNTVFACLVMVAIIVISGVLAALDAPDWVIIIFFGLFFVVLPVGYFAHYMHKRGKNRNNPYKNRRPPNKPRKSTHNGYRGYDYFGDDDFNDRTNDGDDDNDNDNDYGNNDDYGDDDYDDD
jgi:hypothetical protein